MQIKEAFLLFLRYLVVLLVSINNLWIVYLIFTPITVYFSFIILKLYFGASLLQGNIIFVNGTGIELINACIAGAAYYLLLLLNLSTPMRQKKRIYALLFSFLLFFIFNIARIIFFAGFFINGWTYFEIAHKLTWDIGSTIIVVIIWFITVFVFKIEAIPIYTDMRKIIDSASFHHMNSDSKKEILKHKVKKIWNEIETQEKHKLQKTKKEMDSL